MSFEDILKIDIHTHIIPEHIPKWAEKFGYGDFIHLHHHTDCKATMMKGDKVFRVIEENCWDPGVRIKECDLDKVGVQVLSTIPVLFNYWAKAKDGLETSMFYNDHIAEVVSKNPKRFIGLGTIPLQDPQLAIKELHRCMDQLGMAGIQIGSHINDWNLSDPNLFPVFEEAEKIGAAVFVHPWDMMGADKMTRYWLPWLVGMPAETSLAICSMIFGGIFERLPSLRVAFAHGGGSFPASIGRIEHGFNVRPDLVAVDNDVNPRAYLNRFYIDSLVHDPKVLQFNLELFGASQIALGSDYPFPLGEAHPGKLIESMGYDVETTKLLLHGTALKWLNRNLADYK